MNCSRCPFALPAWEPAGLSFVCDVNRLGLTHPAPEADARGALDRSCQFDNPSAAVMTHVHRRRAQILRGMAELRHEIAAGEEALAAMDALEAEV